MSEHVLGSSAGGERRSLTGTSAALSLTMLQAEDRQQALQRLMESGRSWIDRMDVEHPPEPPDEQTVALLEAITSDPGAKDAWRLVGDQVRAGVTTWTSVWLSTEYGRTGQELKLEVISRIARSLDFDAVPDAPAPPPREDPPGPTPR